MARGAALQYVRRFWWVFVAFPVFGLAALAIAQTRTLQALGMLSLLWPFSIPARAVMATSKAARRMSRPTKAIVENRTLFLASEGGNGLKLPLDQLRRWERRGEFYVLETRRFNFILIPVSSFEGREAQFERALDQR